eukprot:CAMPEP_0201475282 /NCGR_PEP_ID=MMETSP0151_2-20130828/738_1 /ASSEMBLY_ACC=CAM_ASM_000257 /TAXON_ID=200890 /ORGANISM="Paramoeba atlantica, Strain 621/1 / CCAP 1560/9" /LENGTH=162 /DNA_ID=CAMNT_0047855335 /DNA_START=35 /DNA_END=523 /DNA_ORIENTATION=-
MAEEPETYTPHVRWAQRKDFVYLKVDIDGAIDPKVKLDAQKVFVSAKGSNERLYEIELEFFEEVVSEDSTWVVQPRYIEMKIIKKTKGTYWDRLLKVGGKRHFLSVDWNKWKDEDESDEDVQFSGNQRGFNDFDFGSQFGGAGGGDDEEDDDEDLPDLEPSP